MSRNIHIDGNVAYMAGSGSVVHFSAASSTAGAYPGSNGSGTSSIIKKLQNELDIAFWGEDNRFPQNVQQQMSHYGLGMAALNWKAEALLGAGIMPCKIEDYDNDGNEVVKPLKRSEGKEIYAFIESGSYKRFQIEYNLDLAWFGNCFPEVILSKDGKKITRLVHQESCDARYQQMTDKGVIENVFLSKLWGASGDQWAKFDPKKVMKGLSQNPVTVGSIDKKFISKLPCIDMYNAADSLKQIASDLVGDKGLSEFKSAIFPTNYPSINKTYYQVEAWDGARLAGWPEIAIKIPAMLKTMYKKAMRLKFHIEIPETHMERRYGKAAWAEMKAETQTEKRIELLKEMDEFLTGEDNAYTTFVSFFDTDIHQHTEYGRVKITPIEDKTSIDKDLLTSSAADIQFLVAAGVHPTVFGAGSIGTGQQRSGGSDIREAFLVYNAMLAPKRTVMLEPLNLVRDYNGWDPEVVFRVRDTVLTTLDKGTGTQKKVS